MKRLFILFIISTFQLAALGQTDSSNIRHKKYKTLYFYTWGLQSNWGYKNKCAIDLEKQYGFDDKTKAGCIVKSGQMRRWERHNERVERKMEKRHGKDWHKKFDAELAKCIK
jgi:hypothetical protein